jgi:hypothetical protein
MANNNNMTDWVKGNIFNIVSTIILVGGSFLATNERVIRLEEKVLSLNDRYSDLEKKIDGLKLDITRVNDKQDQILEYFIEGSK